jgi:glycine reductase
MLKGKKIIAIGERDGVPGPIIAECLSGAGLEVIFQVTECFVWTAAGAMNFENQGVIKRLADQYGPENLAVVLGNGEASGVEVFAETVTQGDPSYAGPLAGVALKIPVYHVLEEEVMAVVPEKLREEKLQLSSLVIDVGPMQQVLQAARQRLWEVPAVQKVQIVQAVESVVTIPIYLSTIW